MAETQSRPRLVRFGAFEADTRTGELRKDGVKLKFSGQPFQVLAILLERPGDVVTREELQKRLWPDTFVDVERNLNTAVNKIREVLGDSAETPHFIETVPRRGYRFIKQVDGAPENKIAEPVGSRRSAAMVLLVSSLLLFAIVATVLLASNAWGWRDRLFSGGPRIEALAVLPFGNLSNDPSQEYFSDGTTDAIRTELGRLGGPRIISRQSTVQFKGSQASLQEIARRLNVDGVLEGTVERSGDRVRINVRLTKVDPERQLWSEKYDGDIRDMLTVQAEIARSVANEVRVKLSQDEKRGQTSPRPVDAQAHLEYLQGLYDADGSRFDDAIAHLKNSIERDPAFAPAHAALADAYFSQAKPENNGPPILTLLPLAHAAAEKALELDPALAQAHLVLGELATADYNWGEAEAQYKEAIRLDASCAECHHELGNLFDSQGRHKEAIAEVEKAIEVNPLLSDLRNQLGMIALTSRHYDQAIAQFKDMHEAAWLPPLATAYMELGRYPEALAATSKCEEDRGGDWCLIVRANIYSRRGKRSEAKEILDQLKESAHHRYVFPSSFFRLYTALGDKEQALTWLERAYEEKDPSLFWLRYDWLSVDPSGKWLRSEPRFEAILLKLNFPRQAQEE
jgi:TolB-like protein/DNA-binding winged helix-turn-helix (wHTH) protein/Tfp pilus assembly protein PilF